MVASVAAAVVSAILYGFAGPSASSATWLSAGVELLKGVWLATPIVGVILAGLLFYLLLSTCWSPQTDESQTTVSPSRLRPTLFSICFLVGPFTETATGFGVGLVVSLGMLLRTGLPKQDAIVFSLFSQMLVPWGAFGVGTMLGAAFADMGDPRELGWRSAVLMAPVILAWLGGYWLMCRRVGLSTRLVDGGRELLWVVFVLAGFIGLSQYLEPDVVGVTVLGSAAALYGLASGGASLRAKLMVAAPYIVLCACLITSRLWPSFHTLLRGVQIQPFADEAAWPILLSPVFWLVLVGLTFALLRARANDVPGVFRMTWQRGKTAAGVTLLFVICARFMMAGDIPGRLALELQATIGAVAAMVCSPLLAAIAGFLTASNSASNSLLMPNVVGLAHIGHWDVAWVAAIQNVTGSALTMLSPVRIIMGCAIAALGAGTMGAIYRRAWFLGVAPVVLMVIAASVVVSVVP